MAHGSQVLSSNLSDCATAFAPDSGGTHSKMSESESNQLLGKIIDMMRENGVKLVTPYDFQNWMYDNAKSHSKLFDTGRFDDIRDD